MNHEDIENRYHKIFDDIKNVDSAGNEHWSAREFSKVLDYSEYRHFVPVVERAKKSLQKQRE
ncbi:DNA-damage-inducible protein D [Candidatus Magnetomorum sp. HK-1]|nr:DNA-damage-inducible protein D [Candidatus Magnetomorum sp. HK-1]